MLASLDFGQPDHSARADCYLSACRKDYWQTGCLHCPRHLAPALSTLRGVIWRIAMSDRLLTKRDIAATFGTSPSVAASILAGQGIMPIDFGAGRGRGARWLESAVVQTMQTMHNQAQKPVVSVPTKPRKLQPAIHLHQMSVADVFRLTQSAPLQ